MDRQEEKSRAVKEPAGSTAGTGTKQNLFRLIKLQFLQRRFFYLGLMLLEAGCVVFGIVVNLRERASLGNGIHISDLGRMPESGILYVLLILCLGSYNAADNKHLKMYPGTRKTRYLSRIILDGLFLLCFAAWLAVLFIASYGIYQVIHLILPDISLLYFFSWNYLSGGCIWYFTFSLLLYGLAQIAYTVMYCLGRAGYLIAWLAGLLVCILSAGMLPPVYHLLTAPLPWQKEAAVYLLAGTALTAVSGIIVIQKKRHLRMVYGSAILLAATVVVSELSLKMAIEYQGLEQYYDNGEEPEENQKNQKRISREFEISWEEGSRMEFLERLNILFPEEGEEEYSYKNCLMPDVEISSVSDVAYWEGDSFDKARVTKEQFLLRLKAVDATYNGKQLYQEILDNIELKKKDSRLYYSFENCYYVLNFMFGNADQFTASPGYNIWDWREDGSISGGMYLDVIIDDETMKTWEFYKEAKYSD